MGGCQKKQNNTLQLAGSEPAGNHEASRTQKENLNTQLEIVVVDSAQGKCGVTDYPGLDSVGLPWLHTIKSGFFFSVGGGAVVIVEQIADTWNYKEASWTEESL